MTARTKPVRIVSASADGWCDPETGLCHIEATDEAEPARGEDSDGPRGGE